VGLGGQSSSAVCDAAAGEFEIVPGQIARELASGLVPEPPAGPIVFGLLHITVAPGPVFTALDDAPSVGLKLIESGELTARIEAAVTVTRTTGPQEVAAATEFTLGPGESFIWPPNVAGDLRNDGSEPVLQWWPTWPRLRPWRERRQRPWTGRPPRSRSTGRHDARAGSVPGPQSLVSPGEL
jgi:hypothetical protein